MNIDPFIYLTEQSIYAILRLSQEGSRQMSSLSHTNLERLEGYSLLPTPEGVDAYGLVLRVKSGEMACVAGQEILLRLAASIQKHIPPLQNSKS
jgi:hypothetical protein